MVSSLFSKKQVLGIESQSWRNPRTKASDDLSLYRPRVRGQETESAGSQVLTDESCESWLPVSTPVVELRGLGQPPANVQPVPKQASVSL